MQFSKTIMYLNYLTQKFLLVFSTNMFSKIKILFLKSALSLPYSFPERDIFAALWDKRN